jgi:hypothetical protein
MGITEGSEERERPGLALTAALRRYFSVGPRTRRYRKGADLHAQMIEAIALAAQYPGYYCQPTQDALRPAFGVALAYDKHVNGYRIDGTLRHHITSLSPWRFAALLGAMADAGVECTGDGERYFAERARKQREEQQR